MEATEFATRTVELPPPHVGGYRDASFRFFMISIICGALGSKEAEADGDKLLGFIQVESGLLDFFGDARHVRCSPRNDEVVRRGQPGVRLGHDMLVAFGQQIIPELFLKMWRRR